MSARCAFAALLWFLAVAPATALDNKVPLVTLDAGRVVWRELRYTTHKLGISATIEVRLDETQMDAKSAGEAGGKGTVPAAQPRREILLESTSHLPGRTFLAHENVDPVRAGVREIVDTETGAKNHRKTYILRDRGFLLELLEPVDGSETLLAPERWTRRTRSFTSYPKVLPTDAVITGPAGLLYAASAARLTSPGDSMMIYVLVQAQVERVVVEVEGFESAEIELQERSGDKLRGVHEQIQALRLVAHSQPVEPSESSAFRLFGLEGDVEILWDAARRLPVEISGHVKLLGRVQVRLASVTLR
jgi:hypothetical protein